MNVFIYSEDVHEKEKKIFEEALKDDDLIFGWDLNDETKAKEFFLKADVAFSGSIPGEWLTETDRLQWLQLESVGFEPYQPFGKAALDKGISITNLKGFFGIPVAETVLGGILSLYRGLDNLSALRKVKSWEKLDIRAESKVLHGSQVIILGSGSIALEIKKLLQAFECKVTVFGKSLEKADIVRVEELECRLPDVDIVICCLPQTDETIGLFKSERLSILKSGALFVNVGRGTVVDEEALAYALTQKRLRGAVIDVTNEEPIPTDHPFWDCPNMVLTQHTGGGSTDEVEGKINVFLSNLERLKNKEDLLNIVDFDKGY